MEFSSPTLDIAEQIKLNKERAQLESQVEMYNQWKLLDRERTNMLELDKANDDEEMRGMIRLELQQLDDRMGPLESQLVEWLLPKDVNNNKNVMLEIRAGTGGDEASIWAGDLVEMYSKYASLLKWKMEVVSVSSFDAVSFLLLLTAPF